MGILNLFDFMLIFFYAQLWCLCSLKSSWKLTKIKFLLILVLFAYIQAFGGDGSDGASPRYNTALADNPNPPVDSPQIRDPTFQMIDQGTPKKGTENSITEIEASDVLPAVESYRSMDEILSSMDPGHPLSASGIDSSGEKPVSKVTSSNLGTKRSAFWGRSNVSFYTCFLIFTENYMNQ